MAVKNILVAYNGSDSSDAALDFALFMRDKYDAHLTGLLAHNPESIKPMVSNWIPVEVRKSVAKAQVQAAEDIRNRFNERVVSNPVTDKIHWISRRGEGDATVSKYARFYDLTIIGRYDAVHGDDQEELHPDKVAMVSGRPVLLVPREFDMSAFNEHAVLAWDGKRASSRALADAMQMLKIRSLVTIVTVDDGSAEESLAEIGIETSLKRHEIRTERVKLKPDSKSVSYRILEYLGQAQPKLLVMGAYEHSKFRQSIVGGVTRNILKKSKVPILISH